MRDAFINELNRISDADSRITVLSSDIGNHMFDTFRMAYPERFVNTGIAEAGMTGIAAGMAMAGLRPFTYTIAAFNPGRCLEQIRLDICQHDLPVTVVGVGAGLSYASLGPTHHALEDIAWMRALPGMTVLCPADPLEVRAAVRAAVAHNGPVYLRLGKKGEPCVHQSNPDFRIGEAIKMRAGTDVALLAVGTVLPIVMAAAEQLAQRDVSAMVHSFHTVKPLDAELLKNVFCKNYMSAVAVIEEHSPSGGAWAAVAEWLAENNVINHVPLLRFGTPDRFLHEAGNQEQVRQSIGLTADAIVDGILKTVK